jgi:hypothetical protein
VLEAAESVGVPWPYGLFCIWTSRESPISTTFMNKAVAFCMRARVPATNLFVSGRGGEGDTKARRVC